MKSKEWIPVTQLLPKNEINVLMCEDDNMYVVSMFYDKKKKKDIGKMIMVIYKK